jgi:hypothetical protein
MRIVQWILAFVFAITAGLKVAAMVQASRGATVVTLFNSLPSWQRWAVVVVELVLAVWLAAGWKPRWGAMAAIVVLSGFMGAVIVEMGRPHPKPCGCFGMLTTGSVAQGLWITFAMDCLMLLGALWVYFRAARGIRRSVTGP